jgi:hypothetical protein
MTSETLQKNNELYRQYHDTHKKYFTGKGLKQFIPDISFLIRNSNIKTVIEYGCGKAAPWKDYNLKKMWQLDKVDFYDPGVEEYSHPLSLPSDLVICVDVMEHIDPECIDEVLDSIDKLSNKAIFFSISTRSAAKKLSDGRNAHLTVQPSDWWQRKIDRLDKLVITHYGN